MLNLTLSITHPMPQICWVKAECCASGLLPIFKSTMHCSGMLVSGFKELHSSPVLSYSGPFLHSLVRESSIGLSPLDGMSAGLSLPACLDSDSNVEQALVGEFLQPDSEQKASSPCQSL